MKMQKKRNKKNDDKWDIFELAFDIIEPLFLLLRFIARVIAKIVHH
ncbi:hypothetical protein [Bacillus sp. T33-2]|nr:hypothetical protein [Bacillus sp. T33-2]